MSDGRTMRAPRDMTRVNVDDAIELEYWCNRFSVPAERLKAAVARVGANVDRIAEELQP